MVAFGFYVLRLKGEAIKLPRIVEKLSPKSQHKNVKFLIAPLLRLISSRGAKLALGTAYLGAVAINFDKLAVLASNPMIFEAGAFATAGLFVYSWSKLSGRWDPVNKDHSGKVFIIGLIMGLSNILMSAGFLYGIVPYVEPVQKPRILLKPKNFGYDTLPHQVLKMFQHPLPHQVLKMFQHPLPHQVLKMFQHPPTPGVKDVPTPGVGKG